MHSLYVYIGTIACVQCCLSEDWRPEPCESLPLSAALPVGQLTTGLRADLAALCYWQVCIHSALHGSCHFTSVSHLFRACGHDPIQVSAGAAA